MSPVRPGHDLHLFDATGIAGEGLGHLRGDVLKVTGLELSLVNTLSIFWSLSAKIQSAFHLGARDRRPGPGRQGLGQTRPGQWRARASGAPGPL